MDEPWGLSGPEFLRLYWIAIGLAVVLVVVAKIRARTAASGDPHDRGDLDPYQLALLTAGPARVEQTAMAGLVSRGAIRVNRTGEVTRPHGGPGPADAVQDYVLGRVPTSGRLPRLAGLGFGDSALGRQLIDGLTRRGYMTSLHRARRLNRVHWVFLVIIAVGGYRAYNGIQLDRPSVFLFLSVFATLWIWIFCRAILGRARSRVTKRGRSALLDARSRYPRTVGVGAMAGFAVLGPVALWGLTAYPDDELSAAFAADRTTSSSDSGSGCGSGCSASSCSSSSSSSGGSSCSSGSSCGGGGCGG
ncbi:hypothetical protein [Alloactinosynnema sp. L-07]|uniref:TIGR04222 domain-containing membrane protein n=1 Tax=Alloactinosynnema sp. L-07 TaxID=1653480 RepID=UPI00065EFE22|nr:TIGR04222 domain-containing membrane protein [Alloactinosynnema sp. L-07]CRK55517.1 hypothetical protein [Alloactinosynnema sp. L-07]